MPKKATKTKKAAKPKKALSTSKTKAKAPKKAGHASKSAHKKNKSKASASHAAPTSAKKLFGKPPFPIKGPKNHTPAGSPHPEDAKKNQARALSPKFLDQQKKKLLELRDHILDQMQGVAQDNLRSRPEGNEASAFGLHQADAGSDAYEKDFALSLLSQEQDALYEIEEALKRIDTGNYGICDMSGKHIPMSRLEAIPFARYTVECQSQIEKEQKGRNRWDTAPQFMDSTESFFEEEETEEEEEKPKLKE